MQRNNNYIANFSVGPAKHFGESGIIREILRILEIPADKRWCVEFGAGNGVSASNSINFIEEGYKAVLIEPMEHRFRLLENLHKNNEGVYTLCRFVEFEGSNSLDGILSEHEVPNDLAFVSIDIDGNDYHIWESLTTFRPRLVCIEINETVPPEVRFVQEKSFNVSQGSGIKSMTELANSKGYELVCVAENNAFYVLKEYFIRFDIMDNSLALMCMNQSSYTKIFFGFDGTIFLEGEGKLRWHSTLLNEEKLQIIPKMLRKFPPNYTVFERFLFRLWRFAYSPYVFLDDLKSRLQNNKKD